MIVLGLTGSIGMGKSEAAAGLAVRGVPVFEADAEVHHLLAKDPAVISEVGSEFPKCISRGILDRMRLANTVWGNDSALDRLEAILHPRVFERADRFLILAEAGGAACVVLEMPLLMESGASELCDAVAVLSAPAAVQEARVLGRPEMNSARLAFVRQRQMSEAEKRARADYVVDSGSGVISMLDQLVGILDGLVAA